MMPAFVCTGGIFIWGAGRAGLAQPITPEQLSAADAGWRTAAEAWGPWHPVTVPDVGWVSARLCPGPPVFVVGLSSSALDCAWHWQAEGAFPVGASVLSVGQWAGRGQLGRAWVSPPGNLHSAWRAPDGLTDLGGMPLSVGIGQHVAAVLTTLGLQAEVKRPNDVLIGGRKVAGILCEQRGDLMMIGLGINLAHAPARAELRDEAATPAGSLAQHGVSLTALDLWLRVREALLDAVRFPETQAQSVR